MDGGFMRNLNMEIHLQGVGRDQLTPLDAVRGEVATLMQGQRFSFDFD